MKSNWTKIAPETWAFVVPGGMLVKTVVVPFSEDAAATVAMTFVPGLLLDIQQFIAANKVEVQS